MDPDRQKSGRTDRMDGRTNDAKTIFLRLRTGITKLLTLFWDESYHNTYIYHINKKNVNSTCTLQLTY